MASFPAKGSTEHHCEAVEFDAHGGNSQWRKCTLHPGHKGFYSVAEFGMEHLPPDLRTEECLRSVKRIIDRTVKITVVKVSEHRPDKYPKHNASYPFFDFKGEDFTRCGTGYLTHWHSTADRGRIWRGSCPCPECKESEKPKTRYFLFCVSTATHVVFDKDEAVTAKVELFYDTDNRQGIQSIYGTDVKATLFANRETDSCVMQCVTHDEELADRLAWLFDPPTRTSSYEKIFGRILVSHPRGASKKISVGTFPSQCRISSEICKLEKWAEDIHLDIPPHYFHNSTQKHDLELEQVKDNLTSLDVLSSTNSVGADKPEQCVHNDVKTVPSSRPNLLHFVNLSEAEGVYKLKNGVRIHHPPILMEEGFGMMTPWFSLPDDSKLISIDGNMEAFIPKGSKVKSTSWIRESYLIYDMPACPGSSGALIVDYGVSLGFWTHFGVNGGKSCSGLYSM